MSAIFVIPCKLGMHALVDVVPPSLSSPAYVLLVTSSSFTFSLERLTCPTLSHFYAVGRFAVLLQFPMHICPLVLVELYFPESLTLISAPCPDIIHLCTPREILAIDYELNQELNLTRMEQIIFLHISPNSSVT